VIITKADLVNEVDLRKALQSTFSEIMKKKRHSCLPIVHVTSAKTSHGLLPLMQSMAEINSQSWDHSASTGQA
jgi:predicted GTPase